MRRLIPLLCVAVALGGCSTLTAPAGSDLALITGELRVDVSGFGTAPNGADGMLNTDVPYTAAVFIKNETDGMTHELRTEMWTGFFSLANARPGTYRVVKLWAQVRTSNSFITITSSFENSPTFEVAAGRVANLGVNRWNFAFDLTSGKSTNSFGFNADFPLVEQALARAGAHSGWEGYAADQVTFSGDVAATPDTFALPPRGSGYDRIQFP